MLLDRAQRTTKYVRKQVTQSAIDARSFFDDMLLRFPIAACVKSISDWMSATLRQFAGPAGRTTGAGAGLPPRVALRLHALEPRLMLDGATFYVDDGHGPETSGWGEDHFAAIQDGIDAAGDGDVVQVQPGSYVENIDFLGKEIVLTSQDPGDPAVVASTIIDGGQQGVVVMFDDGETSASVITGFTITNGYAVLGAGIYCNNGSSPTIEYNVITLNITDESEGAGIRCEDRSSPIIRGNTISNNRAVSGAGIICRHDSSPVIMNNTIAGNTAEDDGGGINCYYSAAEITDNTIIANRASVGGGILTYYSLTRIEGNTIAANHAELGGGIYSTDTNPTIEGNTIAGNTADVDGTGNGGGAFFTESSVAMVNNTIVGNYARQGGGAISCYDSSLAITNCTLSRNRAGWGGGAWLDGCAVDVANSILWDNPDPDNGPQVLFSDPYPREGELSTVAVRYSDVEGGSEGIGTRGNGTASWGDGNLDVGPLFAHGPSGVWSIQPIHDSISHQSVLTDWTASWEVDSLARLLLNPDTSSQALQFPIVSNTATTITVWGDVSSIAAAGEPYEVCDYHLWSEAGRWRSGEWIGDQQSSPYIDAGDPASDFSAEPEPKGGRINMGAHGNTGEASKSPFLFVAFDEAHSSGVEAAGHVDLPVTLSETPNQSVTVGCAATGGTASGNGEDYTLVTTEITFTPQTALTQYVRIEITDDGDSEVRETVEITLSPPPGVRLETNPRHTFSIHDDDGVPTVAFDAATSQAHEQTAATVRLPVCLSRSSSSQVTVDYAVTGGTATGEGQDYTLTGGTLTFAVGDTTEYITVGIVDDGRGEDAETIVVTLSNPSSADLGSITERTHRILDTEVATREFERMWPTLQQPWYFSAPYDVTVDLDGNVYVVDNGNHCIQKFTQDGRFVAKWGSYGHGEGEFDYAIGVAVDDRGFVYVSDANHHVQKFTPDGEFVTRWGGWGSGDGQFSGLAYVAIDSSGFVYTTEAQNNRVQKFTEDGEFVAKWGSFGTGPGQFDQPAGIAVDSHDVIHVVDGENQRIQMFTTDGAFVDEYGNGTIEWPYGMAIDGDDSVYVVDRAVNEQHGYIQKFDSNERWVGDFARYGRAAGELRLPAGVGVDRQGFVYVADTLNDRIQKYTPEGQFVAQWASAGVGEGALRYPTDAAYDSNTGSVYVCDTWNHRVQKFSPNGRFQDEWGAYGTGAGEFYYPSGVAVDDRGYVYVADTWNHRIQRFSSDGELEEAWGSFGSGDGQFAFPRDVVVDGCGTVYVTDTNNDRVQEFTVGGQFLGQWSGEGLPDAALSRPRSICVDSGGFLYVADGEDRVQKFTADGQSVAQWHVPAAEGDTGEEERAGIDDPRGITVDAEGYVCVSNWAKHCVHRFTTDGRLVSDLAELGHDVGQLSHPSGLCVGAQGRIYVVETGNNRVQAFLPPDPTRGTAKAIIVAGGGPFPGNNIWEATQACANFAYRALVHQGFTNQTIQYLSPDTGLDLDDNGEADVDDDATVANLRDAITTWAPGVNRLNVYLVDHGGNATFRMSGTEILLASDLKLWLDALQASEPTTEVRVIYDACESGSFIEEDLTPPEGSERIVITSSSEGESAYFVTQGSISFSSSFWTQIFIGQSIGDAFELATETVSDQLLQNPLLDADGDGIPNEEEDFEIARDRDIGNGTRIFGDAPSIEAVSRDQTITNTNTATLSADNVRDLDGIARVWAVVRPPDYRQGSADNPVLELPSFDLTSVNGPTDPDDRDDTVYEGQFEATYDGFSIPGTYEIAIYARDMIGNTCVPKITKVSVVNPRSRKAIVVAGGSESDALWRAVKRCAKWACEALEFQGYTADDICVVSPEAIPGVTGTPVSSPAEALQSEIERLANDQTQDLVLYLVGDGDTRTFWINETETVSAEELAVWLDGLQGRIPGKVTVVYDAPRSGSFLDRLADPARIVLCSTGRAGRAYFLSGGDISFSKYFWQGVANGVNLRTIFRHAVDAISFSHRGQTPVFDDNGNGVGNEKSDGRWARRYTIGSGIMLAGDDPLIGSVCDAQTLTGETEATISVKEVTTTGEIVSVWAVITPPDYHLRYEAEELPVVQLTDDEGSGEYEVTYGSFDRYGTYEVAIYAKDDDGNLSLPQITHVRQDVGPDVYEDDDAYTTASVFVVDYEPQVHTLYDVGDEDWVRFCGLTGSSYSIRTENLGSNCDTVIEVYGPDGVTRLAGADTQPTGEGEELLWECPGDGMYYIRTLHAQTSAGGAGTEYHLDIDRTVGSPFEGIIAGRVRDAQTRGGIGGAVVIGSPGQHTAVSFADGTYLMPAPAAPGVSYKLTASAVGYSDGSTDVVVPGAGMLEGNDLALTRPQSLRYWDGDGDLVAVEYFGSSGYFSVDRQLPWTARADAEELVLTDTDSLGILRVIIYEWGNIGGDGTTIGSVTGSSIGSLHMPQVDLVGNTIELDGALSYLNVRNIEDGSDIVLGGEATDSLALWAQDVGDVDLTLPGILTQATVNTWADGTIDAHHVGAITTTVGDFGPDLTLRGQDAGGWSLRRADIAGDITGDTWDLPGDLGRLYRRRGRWRVEGLYCGGGLNAALTVGEQAWSIYVGGELQGAVDVGAGFAGSADDRDLYTFYCDGDAAGTLTVHGNAGALRFGDPRAGTGQINAAVQIDGSVDRIDAYGGTGAGGTITVDGNLGRWYRQRGRWRVEGLYCAGDLGAALTVAGQACVIDVKGGLRGAVDIGAGFTGSTNDRDLYTFYCDGDAVGTLAVHGNAGTLRFGDLRAGTGQINAAVQIDGSVDRIDAYGGTGAGGTISVGGDLGRWYKRRGRWRVEGLYCAGDLGAALTVAGQACVIDVKGDLRGAVDIGADFTGSTNDRDLYTFYCDGDAAGTLTVHGNAGTLRFGDLRAGTGQISAAVQIDGSVDRIDAYGGAGETITVGGNLGRWYKRRGRWRVEGLYCAGDLGAALTVAGQVCVIYVTGDLQGAVEIGAGSAESADDRDLHTFLCDGDATQTLTVHGNVGVLRFGDLRAGTGQINAAVQIDGSVDRIDAYGGTGAGGTIAIGENLGRWYRRRRRWRVEGFYCAGDLGAALTVAGQACVIDVTGELRGAVDVGAGFTGSADDRALYTFGCDGDATGTLTVHGHAGTLRFGTPRSDTGKIQGAVEIEGNVDRIDAYEGTGAGGTISVGGDLGRRYRRRRRWRTEGLYCAGDLAAMLSVDGQAWLIDVDGEIQGPVDIGEDAHHISADGDVAGTVTVGTSQDTGGDLAAFYCGSSLSGDLTVHGNVDQVLVRGDASASIVADGAIGYRYRRRGRWRELGVTIAGEFWWDEDGGDPAPVIEAKGDDEHGFLVTLGEGSYRNAVYVQELGTYRITPDEEAWKYWDPPTNSIVMIRCR